MAATAAGVLLTCAECGQERTVGDRQARRYVSQRLAFRCLHCRHAARRVVVDDSARRWWLRQFGEREIATMAAAVSGQDEADLERIARERRGLAS